MDNISYVKVPTKVMLDEELSFLSKLLYAQIVLLSNSKGYCFASNEFLSSINNKVDSRTIRRSLKELQTNNYIEIVLDLKEKNPNKRKIYVKR